MSDFEDQLEAGGLGATPDPELAAPRERTVYTLGPASGSYDIEWANGENAGVGAHAPRAVLVGGQVFFEGVITFSGANNSLNLTLPAALRPAIYQHILCYGYDSDAAAEVDDTTVSITILPNGTFSAEFLNGNAFANGDQIDLSGSYLVAE